MHSYLEAIIREKQAVVEQLRRSTHLQAVLQSDSLSQSKLSFESALKQPGLQVIAEIKRRSPSKGHFRDIQNPVELAKKYQDGGAAAISILTDAFGFGGELADLGQVADTVILPLLRKDFIIDPIQLAETALSGASAVLLIVSLIGEALPEYLELCNRLQLDALVEVHTESECQLAIDSGATMIGINNRNLTTFEVNTQTALCIKPLIPAGVVTIAESGIHSAEVACSYADAGFDAVLVGEFIVKSDDPAVTIHQCRGMV